MMKGKEEELCSKHIHFRLPLRIRVAGGGDKRRANPTRLLLLPVCGLAPALCSSVPLPSSLPLTHTLKTEG